MNEKQVDFKKEVNTQKNSNDSLAQKRQSAKKRLMTKFNMSEEEAEKTYELLKIKVNSMSDNNTNKSSNNDLNQKQNMNQEGLEVDDIYSEDDLYIDSQKTLNTDELGDEINIAGEWVEKQNSFNKLTNSNEKYDELSNEPYDKQGKSEVDSILSDLIPDYNKNISIELNHVSLTFEVTTEKVDTIKEYFIRTIRREKSDKLKIHALKDISLKIYQGEKIGIIGYNGAGKSTLLNVITGIYTPNEGSVTTYGNISPLLSLGAGFDYNYSGRNNILLNGAVLGYDKKFLESKIDEIISFSELGEFIDVPIKNYSSGMLAKLGFSIATALNPDILIIDEILGVGDVNFRRKSSDKIKSLMDGKTTVLLVSHSIPQIRELCDKAIWIDNGTLREMGEVNEVCDHYLKDAEKASNEQLANIQFK